MSEQKEPFIHTPGPWAWEVCDPSLTALGTSDGRGGVDLEVLSVVRCKACQKDPEHRRCMMPNEADARLIAAAPDLLAALIYMRRTMYSNESEESVKADAAIAKALGVNTESHANLPSE